ncbi:3',5'-nucleoside bisphosphate phosphatase [Austwickia sp. TVS 96-490-7B]|uniref:PHP domain-containing protein n=1 Tax=Austwickia sp. TVS 96-490-7B TaxID=2830843 RepID=UPI001C59263A|nr:PHP domain-containing protein [Austwickia sp. TVS 96-490-7B]MBW3086631.1 3',5'-nucleoside bisphosphate phosphatase [Austwickia sp. TVS 96-490-7B]
MLIDLHTHSTASDGTDSPAQLIAAAAAAGVDVVALTDHDTTDGWAAAEEAAMHRGVTVVRGIEVTCRVDGSRAAQSTPSPGATPARPTASTSDISVHILGYLHDPTYQPLQDRLAKMRRSRHDRARRIVEALAADLPITMDDVASHVPAGATIGRPHIADTLVTLRVVQDRAEAFRRFLYDGSPYVVPHHALTTVEALQLIIEAGGIPVLAHPCAAVRGRVVADDVIEEMVEHGLVGLETHHPDHTPDQVAHAEDIARVCGLVATGSSDYHGTGKPHRLAQCVTDRTAYEQLISRPTAIPVLQP